MIKDGDLDVQYVRSNDNPADIMTKNSKEVLYIKHAATMKKGEQGGCRGICCSGTMVGQGMTVRRSTTFG